MWDEAAAWLSISAGTLPFFALVGYASELGSLYGVNLPTPMALNAAAAGLLLSVAMLVSLPDTGVMLPFSSPGSGGIMARRLFPLALGIPIGAGLLLSEAVNRSLLDKTTAIATFIISVVIIDFDRYSSHGREPRRIRRQPDSPKQRDRRPERTPPGRGCESSPER